VSTLPTPTSRDWKGHNQRGDDTCLTGALLPTPAVNDMGRGKTPEDWDAWTDKMKAAHGNGNGHGKSLEIEAARIGAITAPPSPDGNASSDDTHPHQLSLDAQAMPA
jgi:DNA (cytosine-5)-methyltransferase 1